MVLEQVVEMAVERFQRRCGHPYAAVRADIMEGDGGTKQIQWCLRCGGFRVLYLDGPPGATRMSPWRTPRATWWRP